MKFMQKTTIKVEELHQMLRASTCEGRQLGRIKEWRCDRCVSYQSA